MNEEGYLQLLKTYPQAVLSYTNYQIYDDRKEAMTTATLYLPDAVYNYINSVEAYLISLSPTAAQSDISVGEQGFYFITSNFASTFKDTLYEENETYIEIYKDYMAGSKTRYIIFMIALYASIGIAFTTSIPMYLRIVSKQNFALQVFALIKHQNLQEIIGGVVEFRIVYLPEILEFKIRKDISLQEEEHRLDEEQSFIVRNSREIDTKDLLDPALAPLSEEMRRSVSHRSATKSPKRIPTNANNQSKTGSSNLNKFTFDDRTCRNAFQKLQEEKVFNSQKGISRKASPEGTLIHLEPVTMINNAKASTTDEPIVLIKENNYKHASMGLTSHQRRKKNGIHLLKKKTAQDWSKDNLDEIEKSKLYELRRFRDMRFWPILKQIIIAGSVFFPWVIFSNVISYSFLKSYDDINSTLDINMEVWMDTVYLRAFAWEALSRDGTYFVDLQAQGKGLLTLGGDSNSVVAIDMIANMTDQIYKHVRELNDMADVDLPNLFSDYKKWHFALKDKNICTPFSFNGTYYEIESILVLLTQTALYQELRQEACKQLCTDL